MAFIRKQSRRSVSIGSERPLISDSTYGLIHLFWRRSVEPIIFGLVSEHIVGDAYRAAILILVAARLILRDQQYTNNDQRRSS
jgi:hypothetical protein